MTTSKRRSDTDVLMRRVEGVATNEWLSFVHSDARELGRGMFGHRLVPGIIEAIAS